VPLRRAAGFSVNALAEGTNAYQYKSLNKYDDESIFDDNEVTDDVDEEYYAMELPEYDDPNTDDEIAAQEAYMAKIQGSIETEGRRLRSGRQLAEPYPEPTERHRRRLQQRNVTIDIPVSNEQIATNTTLRQAAEPTHTSTPIFVYQ
jgi:hypothetical protein